MACRTADCVPPDILDPNMLRLILLGSPCSFHSAISSVSVGYGMYGGVSYSVLAMALSGKIMDLARHEQEQRRRTRNPPGRRIERGRSGRVRRAATMGQRAGVPALRISRGLSDARLEDGRAEQGL